MTKIEQVQIEGIDGLHEALADVGRQDDSVAILSLLKILEVHFSLTEYMEHVQGALWRLHRRRGLVE